MISGYYSEGCGKVKGLVVRWEKVCGLVSRAAGPAVTPTDGRSGVYLPAPAITIVISVATCYGGGKKFAEWALPPGGPFLFFYRSHPKVMKKPADDTGTIARSASTVSVAVMCSRVLGLVREQAFASLFGAGFAYDSFVVAFRIPNLLRDLFGEGALSSAFVAVFSDYDAKRGPEETWRLAGNVLVFFAILLSCLTLLGMFFAKPLVLLLAPILPRSPTRSI